MRISEIYNSDINFKRISKIFHILDDKIQGVPNIIILTETAAIIWIFFTKDQFQKGKKLIKSLDSGKADIVIDLLDVAAASSAIGLGLSGLITLVNVIGILLSYRADIKRLYKGEYSKFLVKKEAVSASVIVF
ncbi:hypothetical protein CHS0354_020977 [Potamilus streckersoni]|uniref:Uncharacterized protein n=1 Tax=Potamilus streckersoni TaxID=2493646 RepID=A0AAE0W551_9BIVA|nr:hypothetical protein CHS0354_020977 [Potamilus streckersoni]